MKNQNLVNEGLLLIDQLNQQQPIAANNTAVIQQLHQAPQMVAYLIAPRVDAATSDRTNLVAIARKMETTFNDSELQTLCFALNIDYDNLAANEKQGRIRELILKTQRHGRFPALLQQLDETRDHIDWGDPLPKLGEHEIETRLNIAVVIEYARPALRDAARHLDDLNIEANVVYLRHPNPGQFLSPQTSWQEIVRGFSQVMNNIKHTFSGAQLHFMLSAPGALLFGFGCIWGTVDEAIVYHYEKSGFYPVLPIMRELRW